jgi:predicted ester cyclase
VPTEEVDLSTLEENDAVVRKVTEEGLNKKNYDIADEFITEDYVAHVPGVPELPTGPEAFKWVITMWHSAFPDWNCTIDEQVAQRDIVVQRLTTRGTHDGYLMGIPPTHKKIRLYPTHWHRVEDGKVAESWIAEDMPVIMVQLGLLGP